MHTVEWVFSGIGVAIVIVLGRWLYNKFSPPTPAQPPQPSVAVTPSVAIRSGVGSTTVLHKNTKITLDHSVDVTVRIRMGDYYTAEADYRSIRVEVTDIRTASVPNKYGDSTTKKLVAELNVSVGGGIIYGGASTVSVGVNKYLVAQVEFDESAESIYAFHTKDSHYSFLRISVTHINAHDRCADVSIVQFSASAR